MTKNVVLSHTIFSFFTFVQGVDTIVYKLHAIIIYFIYYSEFWKQSKCRIDSFILYFFQQSMVRNFICFEIQCRHSEKRVQRVFYNDQLLLVCWLNVANGFERENSNAKVYIIQMGEMLVFKSSCARAFLIITWVPWPWETRSSVVHLIPFRITF